MPAPIILFDGVCKLCSAWANFIIEHDAARRFRLCSVQSAAGQRLLAEHNYPTDTFETMLVVDGERRFEKSAAFFVVMKGGPAAKPQQYAHAQGITTPPGFGVH